MGTLAPLGDHRVQLRGVDIDLAVQHYSVWMLWRVLDQYDALTSSNRVRVDKLLEATGLDPLIHIRPARRLERVDFIEVLV